MLFEQESLTPGKRADALSRLFCTLAARTREGVSAEHIPLSVLEAHGDLENHLRYMIEAAYASCKDKKRLSQLRRIEKLLDSLPTGIMQTLPASPEQDWMRCYRDLVKLHDMLDEAGLCVDAQEYAAIIEKTARLAQAVSEGSAVQVNAASMFALWLMQAHLRRYQPRRRRPARRKKRKHRHTPRRAAGE